MKAILAVLILFLSTGLFSQNYDPFYGWESLWTRDPGTGTAEADGVNSFMGKSTVHIEFDGKNDWSLNRKEIPEVNEGDIYELSINVKYEGTGDFLLCMATYDDKNRIINWIYGYVSNTGKSDWKEIRKKFIIQKGVKFIRPRLIGSGRMNLWIAGFNMIKTGSLDQFVKGESILTLENPAIKINFNAGSGLIGILDKRNNKEWKQRLSESEAYYKDFAVKGNSISGIMYDLVNDIPIDLKLTCDAVKPEFSLVLSSKPDNPLKYNIRYPFPLEFKSGTDLIIPLNEGISIPVDDGDMKALYLQGYSGHGICMAFWGASDGKNSMICIIETPDDFFMKIDRLDKINTVIPEWQPQKGGFGYDRKLRYAFFDKDGHVAIAKRYRSYAKETGNFKTLLEKRKEKPAIDLLVGAANIWCWDRNASGIVNEMKELGMNQILWSNRLSPEQIDKLNALGVLTSRYDIYQDAMNPENYKMLKYIQEDWTSEAWANNDIIIDKNGGWIKGWEVETKDGGMIPCGVLCDSKAVSYAEKRLTLDLKNHNYKSRFIDTTTASPFRECYSPLHPMTRTDSRYWKMELLRLVSDRFKLVCGSETGIDSAVNYADYFEGMLSLGPYRVPDSGRDMQAIWDKAPEEITKYQLGQKYRIPLWELVYHDCVVAQWYWGDYNNKLPAVWEKRDLFNILYGTPPMYMFYRKLWDDNKMKFAESYKKTTNAAKMTGYHEMTYHKYLTSDRNVQESTFSNGVKVIVNFSEKTFITGRGGRIKPGGYLIEN